MDLEQKLIARRKELAEEKAVLERLRHTKRLETKRNAEGASTVATSLTAESLQGTLAAKPLSIVNRIPRVEVDVPPASEDGFGSGVGKRKKTFADVLGDGRFAYDEDALRVGAEAEAFDVSGEAGMYQDGADELSTKALGSRVTLRDEKWTMHRPVNALRFHQKHEDVLLSAHGSSSVAASEGGGVVNVWSLDGGDSCLQRTLIANACMTSLVLPSISPATVIGGTFSGDVLTWDLRARASTPAQRAGSFSADPGFSHSCSPIYSLEMAPGNKGECISASANGTICMWSLSSLDRPIAKLQVRNAALTGTVRVSALAVPGLKTFMGGGRDNKSSQYVFAGGEDGGVYRFENHSGSWGIGREIAAHAAPVTSMSVHPTSRKWPQLNDVVLSASMDWTVKICGLGPASLEEAPKAYSTGMPGIVSDVQWSPVHPCIFATGDEEGGVSLFDAERSFKNNAPPSCRHTFKESGSGAGASPSIARLQWSKDGRQLSAGDIEGAVSVWRCSNAVANSSSQEWERMSEFLKKKRVF